MGEGGVHTTHRWKADPALIPRWLRPFVTPRLLEWTGFADWRLDAREVSFEFVSDYVRDLYDCRGTFRVLESAGHALVCVGMSFDVHAYRVQGVPRPVVARAARLVERTLCSTVRPSLSSLPDAVARLLQQERDH